MWTETTSDWFKSTVLRNWENKWRLKLGSKQDKETLLFPLTYWSVIWKILVLEVFWGAAVQPSIDEIPRDDTENGLRWEFQLGVEIQQPAAWGQQVRPRERFQDRECRMLNPQAQKPPPGLLAELSRLADEEELTKGCVFPKITCLE